MKQVTLFGDEFDGERGDRKYSTKVESPVYVPRGVVPHLLELVDLGRVNRLVREIECSGVSEGEKVFLIEAARRHAVFNYEKIADYYANSGVEMQGLMERSGLVIIDFERAIEFGYLRVCDEIRGQYLEEYEK